MLCKRWRDALILLPASEKGGSEDPEGSGAPGVEERQAGRQTQFPKPWTWTSALDGRVRCPGWHQLATQGWGVSSALLTLLLAFSLLINMSWGWRGGKAQNNRSVYLPVHLGKGWVCEGKIGQKSVLHILKGTPNCGFKFSVAVADESSGKSRFSCKPS